MKILHAVALFVALVPLAARAEVYTMYAGPSATGPNVASTVSMPHKFQTHLVWIPSGNATGSLTTNVQGSLVADMNLDATNSGTLLITGSNLTLDDTTVNQTVTNGIDLFQYPFSISLDDVGLSIETGPISVTNGTFEITAATAGFLKFDRGVINYLTSFPLLGIYSVPVVVDLAVTPIEIPFSSLGALVITGTADDDLGGVDTTSADPHSETGPGTTGLSLIDTDAAEVTLQFADLLIQTTMSVGTIPSLPFSINLSGSIAVGVPELGSATMMCVVGSSLAGGLWLSRRRRV